MTYPEIFFLVSQSLLYNINNEILSVSFDIDHKEKIINMLINISENNNGKTENVFKSNICTYLKQHFDLHTINISILTISDLSFKNYLDKHLKYTLFRKADQS